MLRNNELDAIVREQARGRQDRKAAGVRIAAIGDGSACGCDIEKPESFHLEYLDRLYTSDAQSTTIIGGAAGAITFNPTDMFFQPVAVAAIVRDATDPMIGREAWITAVGIKGCQQLEFNNTAPVITTSQYIPSELWDPIARNNCGCPVRWATYSSNGNGSQNLQITLFNPHPVGATIRVTITIWGRAYSCCPAWLQGKTGEDMFRRPPPPERGPTFMTAPVQLPAGSVAPVGGRGVWS